MARPRKQATSTTVFDTITTATFGNTKVLVPHQEVLSTFEGAAKPLFKRILTALHESRTLILARDTLLPKLLSGEVRVKDAERMVEATT